MRGGHICVGENIEYRQFRGKQVPAPSAKPIASSAKPSAKVILRPIASSAIPSAKVANRVKRKTKCKSDIKAYWPTKNRMFTILNLQRVFV